MKQTNKVLSKRRDSAFSVNAEEEKRGFCGVFGVFFASSTNLHSLIIDSYVNHTHKNTTVDTPVEKCDASELSVPAG